MNLKLFEKTSGTYGADLQKKAAQAETTAKAFSAELHKKTELAEKATAEIKSNALKYGRKYLWFFPLYIIGYILVERFPLVTAYHTVQCAADGLIPFCEYFVIPYYLWHAAILVFTIYAIRRDPDRFERFIRFLIVCSCIVFPIFILFPSCQNLRPVVFPRNNIFTELVRLTYLLDTSTNVTPSMHVIGCFGLLFSCWNMKEQNNRKGHFFQLSLFMLICASTVFLKQHSLIDVIAAVPVSFAGWWISGKKTSPAGHSRMKAMLAVLFAKGKVFTIPNIMSFFRICLIPVIIRVYIKYKNALLVTALVVLSGLTDILDGFIARHFHQMSDLGKILDPVADKLTQLSLLYILTEAYPLMWTLIGIILFKELVQGFFGYLMLRKNQVVHSSQWFGKLSTVLLYATAICLILFSGISPEFSVIAIVLCAAGLILALVLYTRFYFRELFRSH